MAQFSDGLCGFPSIPHGSDTFTEVVDAVLERSMLERMGNFATARKLDEVTEHRHLKILLLMICLDIHIQ